MQSARVRNLCLLIIQTDMIQMWKEKKWGERGSILGDLI